MRNTSRTNQRCRNSSGLFNRLYEDINMLEMYLNSNRARSSADKKTPRDISTAFYDHVVEAFQSRLQKKLGISTGTTDTTERYTTLRQLIIDGCVETLKRRHRSDNHGVEHSSDEPSEHASEEQVSEYTPRIDKVERKLEKVLSKLAKAGQDDDDDDDDDDDEDDGRSRFPNLKYAQPKYQNLESVIKHVESNDGKGGFKLVIMNFND